MLLHVVVRPLAVLRHLVVARAAREDTPACRCRAACATESRRRRRPCSGPTRAELASASPRRAPCRDRSACPGYVNGCDIQVFMPEIEVAHHEDERLEPLGQVERLHRHLVALLDRAGQQHDVLRVAVRCSAAKRRSPCAVRVGRPVDGPTRWMSKITRRHLGVVRQAGELATSARCRGRTWTSSRARRPSWRRSTMPSAAISSSACTMANVALPVSLSMRYFRM